MYYHTSSIYFKQIKTQQSALISEGWTLNFDSDCWAILNLVAMITEESYVSYGNALTFK